MANIRPVVLFLILGAAVTAWSAPNERRVAAYMSPRDQAVLKSEGTRFTVARFVGDMADMGVTDIFFFEHHGEGGPFYHRTTVPHTVSASSMRGRDYLDELLQAATARHVRVWLAWSPPGKSNRRMNEPEFKDGLYSLDTVGLDSAALRSTYKQVMDELARDYRARYPEALAGFFWHEIHSALGALNTPDDVDRFKAFCRAEFSQEYPGAAMPEVSADDVWWRRLFLYRIHVATGFVREMAEHARALGFQTGFCHYPAETSAGWTMGADVLELEQICDLMWEVSFALENCKHYYSIKGAYLDFGPTYRNTNLPRNFVSAFHGYPLSYFEFATPMYVNEIRSHFPPDSEWVKAHGDFYTGHSGRTEKDVELFYGKQNLGGWLKLMAAWQPGETPAQIAAAINPTPFIMGNPTTHSKRFLDTVSALMEALTYRYDVDGFVSGSAAMAENLKRYPLILLPEDMATGLPESAYLQYVEYVRRGGHILVVNTPVTTGSRDLTDVKDRTGELCGVLWKGRGPEQPIAATGLAGQFLPGPDATAAPGLVEAQSAEVLVRQGTNGVPLLTRFKLGQGQVWFSALSYKPALTAYFQSIAGALIRPTLQLAEADGIRILEAVRKDQALCLVLWGTGSARIQVDAGAAGLKGPVFQARDIVTGRVLAPKLTAADLGGAGVEVRVPYKDQPCVVAIGSPEAMAAFPGLYPSEEVFRDVTVKRLVEENPQVPILVPEGSGIKAGVYHRGLGAPELVAGLAKSGFRAFLLPRLDREAMSYPDVIVIPQFVGGHDHLKQAEPVLRSFVQNGGGVVLIHDATGYRKHSPVFPEIGLPSQVVKNMPIRAVAEHAVTAGLPVGAEFLPGFQYDHLGIEKGSAGQTVVADDKGNAVVVVGQVGKGRVVLSGMLTGSSGGPDDTGGKPGAPAGQELRLFENALRWAAGTVKSCIKTNENRGGDT